MQNIYSEIGFVLLLLNEPNFNNAIINTKVLGDDRDVSSGTIRLLNESQVFISIIDRFKSLGLSDDNLRRVDEKFERTQNKALLKDFQESIIDLSQPKDTVELVTLILLEEVFKKDYVKIQIPLIKEELYAKYVILTQLFLYKLKKDDYIIEEGKYNCKHLKRDYISEITNKDIENINNIGKSIDKIFGNILNLEIDEE